MLYRWSFAEKTCSPQSNTSNKRKVNNWSVLAKPKQNMAFTQFCAHCALWLSSLTKLQTITFNMNGNGLTTTSQFSQLTYISSSWQWKTTCTYSGIWPLGNWICSQFDLHHFHHLCEWDILNFGNFWNPSIKRNNVPHNKTLILACQYCKCWHLSKSWPASTGFLVLVACTHCSSAKDDYTCFPLNQMLLGNLCFSFWLTEKDCNGKMFISIVHF
jgi:hypothetical protein